MNCNQYPQCSVGIIRRASPYQNLVTLEINALILNNLLRKVPFLQQDINWTYLNKNKIYIIGELQIGRMNLHSAYRLNTQKKRT